MAILDPVCSTDQIWRQGDTSRCLSNELVNIEDGISRVDEKTVLRALNKTATMTKSNGTFSATFEDERFENGKVYLVSIKYTKGNALVDQSLYSIVWQDGLRLVQSYNIVKCYSGNDNFIAQQTNRVMTIASTYTGDADSATVRFI